MHEIRRKKEWIFVRFRVLYIAGSSGHTVFEVRIMAKKHHHIIPDPERTPLPIDQIQKNARHGKTASDLPREGELPIATLAKSIPTDDLHEM